MFPMTQEIPQNNSSTARLQIFLTESTVHPGENLIGNVMVFSESKVRRCKLSVKINALEITSFTKGITLFNRTNQSSFSSFTFQISDPFPFEHQRSTL